MSSLEPNVVPAGMHLHGSDVTSLLRLVKRGSGSSIDNRFFAIVVVSVAIHVALMFIFDTWKLRPVEATVIEEVPERFAQLIIEKPLPKNEPVKKELPALVKEPGTTGGKSSAGTAASSGGTAVPGGNRDLVRRSVDNRVARVEQRLRTVGVLGMLTGVGTTAKGPSVVDVLGSLNEKKESTIDLDAALDNMTGLQKTVDVTVLDKKLVKSRDLAATAPRENIDDLLANVGHTDAVDLVKKGSFIIQKPESIEGAASSNAKRDNTAINAIVATHKTSLRMSYDKFLKRDPSLAGKISIRFTITAAGTVANAAIIENTTSNQELAEEILRKIRMWTFESIAEGDVTVTYPFVFSSAG